jgi:glycosyltransferase involved in cell wall biosynthesis
MSASWAARRGLNAYLLHAGDDYRAAGVSVYTKQLLFHLPVVCPEHSYLAFHGKDAPPLSGVVSVVSPLPTQRPLARVPWEQVALPILGKYHELDVLHGTVNVVPRWSPFPTVVTVHDLAFLRYPQRFPVAKQLYLRQAVASSARRADHVIAVSKHTRADLIDLLGIAPERISVVYSGVDARFHRSPPTVRADFRRRAFAGRPYILHVGTLEPRKNLDVLIRAFTAVRQQLDLPHVLALVGAPGWDYRGLFALTRRLGVEGAVRFVGYVDPSELPLWYNGAELLAYPSEFEGFGLPVLEAMACGTPVITSASSALQEITGTAGVTVEPGSEEALQVAMARVLRDRDLQTELSEAGWRRAAQFTWQETARRTVEVYSAAVEQ